MITIVQITIIKDKNTHYNRNMLNLIEIKI
jgi:hypothetical protein